MIIRLGLSPPVTAGFNLKFALLLAPFLRFPLLAYLRAISVPGGARAVRERPTAPGRSFSCTHNLVAKL